MKKNKLLRPQINEASDRLRFDALKGYADKSGLHPRGGKGVSLEDILSELKFKELGDFLRWFRFITMSEITEYQKDWCSGDCCQSLLSKLVRLSIEQARQFEKQGELQKSAMLYEDYLYILARDAWVVSNKKFGTSIKSDIDYLLSEDDKLEEDNKKRNEFIRDYVKNDGHSLKISRKLVQLHTKLGNAKEVAYWSRNAQYLQSGKW